MSTKRKISCGCLLSVRHPNCAYCGGGGGDGEHICGRCRANGIDGPVIKGTSGRDCPTHKDAREKMMRDFLAGAKVED